MTVKNTLYILNNNNNKTAFEENVTLKNTNV